MLRVLKQKAVEDSSAGGVKASESNESSSHSPIIVSHVPISIGSHTGSSDTTSTISSKSDNFNVVEGETTHNANHVSNNSFKSVLTPAQKNQDSWGESSPTMAPGNNAKPLNRGRSVSLEDLQAPERPTKKAKVLDVTEPGVSRSFSLATENDQRVLNPLHVFVRKQIEAFKATDRDLRQPAPGRKQPIRLNQVGLRCIHCKNKPKTTRVKRAVCYPTSIGRIYSAVSDMKFDHLNHCKNLPEEIRSELDQLKKRCEQDISSEERVPKRKPRKSSTSQYYCDSAMGLGMYDGSGGIFLRSLHLTDAPTVGAASHQEVEIAVPPAGVYQRTPQLVKPLSIVAQKVKLAPKQVLSPSLDLSCQQERKSLQESTDEDHLNAIHCFVRRHTEFFAANEDDIASPAPGRKAKVLLGQVGVRCIHCCALPPRQRVKRAACYPPRVEGIYHAISNMKFDHFAKCQSLPVEVRHEFKTLQEAYCRKGSGGNAGGAASSTKKYYRASAIRKGLTDTESGIRFQQQGVVPVRSSSPVASYTSNRMSTLVEVACLAI